VGELQTAQQARLRQLGDVRVRVDEPCGPCPRCGGPMHVRKTSERDGLTLAHGRFRVHQAEYVCAKGCTAQPPGAVEPRPLVRRPSAVTRLLLPRSTVGYDLMVFVGLQRFVHFHRRDEIRAELADRHGIVLSSGQTSLLGRRFLAYLEGLHEARAPELRRALEARGGFPLHIDASVEDGRGTLLAAFDGWRRWVLGAWKIPTERADAILPKLREVVARFGRPCAVMRDLGKAVIEAARELVAGLTGKVPVLGCHLHFLKDIGKDILRPAHDELRDLFRRFAVLPHLRSLVRELGRRLGTELDEHRRDFAGWLAGEDCRFRLPGGGAGLAVVRGLGQWILDYPHDGTDAGFPFDRPYLDLYRRALRALRAIDSLLGKPCHDLRVHQALERLHGIVRVVRSELPFQRPARTLERRARLHDELRRALRLRPKRPPTVPGAADTQQQAVELRDVKKAVQQLTRSLARRRPERGPAQDEREAIDIVLEHFARHGPSLWGHVITLPAAAGGGIRLVERTNVLLENLWHEIKRGERQRSGRKVLTQDFEQLPAAALLARNLTRPDYVALLCGSLDNLADAFADLDAADSSLSLPARRRAASPSAQADDEIISRSLPRPDRDLVRTDAMQARVAAEANSRAPRWELRRCAG
jgi:hypothetical protein